MNESETKETKEKPTNLAFCHTIPTISACTKAKISRKTITERNLQKSAPHIVQKRAVAQRHTHESQTMKKAILNTRWGVV